MSNSDLNSGIIFSFYESASTLLLNNTSWLNLAVNVKFQNANESNIYSKISTHFLTNMKYIEVIEVS